MIKTLFRGFFAAALLFFAFLSPLAASSQHGILTERMLRDPLTGIALYSYDPVSFFLPTGPRLGEPAYETIWEGLVWRFENAANREAFLRNPTIYMPRFGGYDPVIVGRGFATAGNPLIFIADKNGLIFFRSEQNREIFLTTNGPAQYAQTAWDALSRRLIQ